MVFYRAFGEYFLKIGKLSHDQYGKSFPKASLFRTSYLFVHFTHYDALDKK